MPSYQVIYHFKDTTEPFLGQGLDLSNPDNWDGQEVFYCDTDEKVGQIYDENGEPTKTPERLKQETIDIQREIFRVTGHTALTLDDIKEVFWKDEDASE